MPGGVAVLGLAALALGALALSRGSKAAPTTPSGAAPTSGTFEFDPNLPPQLEAQALGAIKLGTAAELRTFADQLDAMGYHLTAASLRQRAAELAPAPQAIPPAVPTAPVAPAPAQPAPVPAAPTPSVPPVPAPSVAPPTPLGPPIPPLVVPAPSPATPPPAPSPPPPGGLSGLDPNDGRADAAGRHRGAHHRDRPGQAPGLRRVAAGPVPDRGGPALGEVGGDDRPAGAAVARAGPAGTRVAGRCPAARRRDRRRA